MPNIATQDVVDELKSISKGLSKIRYMLENAEDYEQALSTTRSVERDVDKLIERIRVARE